MRIIKASLFFALCIVLSCEDIFVEDISSDEVILVAPADSVDSYQTNQLFLWQPVAGATEYQVTLFSPDLATAGSVVLDTVVMETSFKLSLSSGSYEWCVKAGNGVYTTGATCHKLTIRESVSGKKVNLLAPADDAQSSNSRQIFWWDAVNGATQYTLVVVSPDLLTLDEIVIDTVLTKTSFTAELEVGEYEWCVKASDRMEVTELFCRSLEIIEE